MPLKEFHQVRPHQKRKSLGLYQTQETGYKHKGITEKLSRMCPGAWEVTSVSGNGWGPIGEDSASCSLCHRVLKATEGLEMSDFPFLSALASGNLPADEKQAEAGYHSSL